MRRFFAFPVIVLLMSACADATGPGIQRNNASPRPSSTATSGYAAIDVGTLGGAEGYGWGINNPGQVVGYSTLATGREEHAFRWAAGAGMSDLGSLGGGYSHATDINDAGQIVGYSWSSGGSNWYAFIWESSTGMIPIAGPNAVAQGINASGQVAGSVGGRAFVWEAGTGLIDLGIPASHAWDINNLGQVVGHMYTATGDRHAFLWEAGTGMIDLGTLGGNYSEARAINDAGQVVGFSNPGGYPMHAFIWETASGMTDLGTLGGTDSWAYDINNSGQVVGQSYLASGPSRAFLWEAGSGMSDLGPGLSNGSSWAWAINEIGYIAGASDSGNQSDIHATLWVPAGITVEIDIKPGSDPNTINPKGKGVVPVAVLGSAEFDVAEIDRTTLAFGPDGAAPAHQAGGHLENVNGDGYVDLVSHYRQQATGLAFGDTEACVTGQTLGGTAFDGCDAIRVLNK